MPERTFTSRYRYGYQGAERDQEVHDNNDVYTTEYRLHDARLGRWFSSDPLEMDSPHQSPYCSMDNNPILYNDVDGDKIDYGKFGHGKWRNWIRIQLARIFVKGFNDKYKMMRDDVDEKGNQITYFAYLTKDSRSIWQKGNDPKETGHNTFDFFFSTGGMMNAIRDRISNIHIILISGQFIFQKYI